jgi:hypothetical protein
MVAFIVFQKAVLCFKECIDDSRPTIKNAAFMLRSVVALMSHLLIASNRRMNAMAHIYEVLTNRL